MTAATCWLCGQTATGFASIYNDRDGDRRYCHGDDDCEPTCYEQAQWVANFGDRA